MDFLSGLNPQQKEAVCHLEGPLLLLAGAGSGKTRVITHRMAHLMEAHHVPGPSILAVTFTNKAADEMRQRVLRLVGDTGRGSAPLVATFHSFCVRLLRRDGERLADLRPGFNRNFTIYDDDDQVSLLKSIYKTLGLTDEFMPYRAMSSWISNNKSRQKGPTEVFSEGSDDQLSRKAVIYQHYEQRLLQANALDFDDLLLEPVRLLAHNQELREQYNRRFEFLMIDEYQDTNRTQYELMRLMTQEHKNVCVVGDEDQSIYGWRGADIRNILDFERDFPNAAVIRLEQNYRSTKNILEAASALVAHNTERKGKWLWTDSGDGERVSLYQAPDGENEALFIADTIERILVSGDADRVAVLYRTNSQSRQIEEALRRYGRKYIVVGGFSFYQRAEVKDALAYLKVLASPQDTVSLLRIINTPARGIGKTTVEQMEHYASEHHLSLWLAMGKMLEERLFPPRADAALRAFERMMAELAESAGEQPLHTLVREVLERTGYLDVLESDNTPESGSRRANLDELMTAAAEATERGENLNDFLDHAALVSDSDNLDERAKVSLLTMHNAKGLEFPVVFIAGLEEGLFPHSRSLESEPAMEEERRLCYVGMTRAEKKLYLSWARTRRKYGGSSPEACKPSRFLLEIPPGLIERAGRDAGVPQLDLYSERQQVRETVRKNLYTGKTYNSVENIHQFFAERGGQAAQTQAPQAAPPVAQAPVIRQATKKAIGQGTFVRHPKYGRGRVLRREGDGDDAKLTVEFPGYGLKKLVQKFSGIQVE